MLIRRQNLRLRQPHPSRERLLDFFGVIRRQAIFGLQDRDRARLQVSSGKSFDLPNEVHPYGGGLLDTELFPPRRGDRPFGSELARADRSRREAWSVGSPCFNGLARAGSIV